ncbi:Glucose-1-phosphate cytidylyltransferase [Rubripirellula amarantea]|uniref:Glucose-1-phosphate cytidylyltransferase n=1 Tax=Rubripirellula amarantea TaxID=2527999 RepID=A0A5C5WQF8_9BACT|nr:glucose-1-phosphate cytidylyltransferase [Rubripirellula amarantea]TWT52515.1 Glucose-1-phosphate cytidylyltransferase [Rubripirellula amarantea]
MILCGGQGTRLREETEYRPKPMVEIGGRPILWHIMKMYARFEFHHFVLCLGYRGQMIKDYFLKYQAMNNDFTLSLGQEQEIEFHGEHSEQSISVTLADTGLPTMTGGRVLRASRYIDEDTFMLTYGDGVADINIEKLVAFHRSHGKLATISTTRPMSRFGELDLRTDGMVNRFVEKPQSDSWSSCGFFVLDRRVLDLIDGDDCIFEREPLERLAKENELVAYRHDGFFFAMDTYREYQHLNELWSSGDAPWKVW